MFLDTMYVGNLKGVGKVWQYTGVDGARSFGFARARAGKKNAATMADFLEHADARAFSRLDSTGPVPGRSQRRAIRLALKLAGHWATGSATVTPW